MIYMYGNKFNNLEILRDNGILIPKSLVFDEYNSNIDFSLIEEQLSCPIILRSSYDLEDGTFLFPGIFKSFFPIYRRKDFTRYKNLLLNYRNDYLYREYITINNINTLNYKMNIIVQEYIIGDFSGIIFIDDNYIKIECIQGLNNLLTSNLTNSSCKLTFDIKKNSIKIDDFFIDSKYLTIKDRRKVMIKVDNSFLFEEYIILNYIDELIKISKKIKTIFNRPQDIEFTISNNMIYIIQSRILNY